MDGLICLCLSSCRVDMVAVVILNALCVFWYFPPSCMSHVVGEVTYVELFKDAEGKSRVSADAIVLAASFSHV